MPMTPQELRQFAAVMRQGRAALHWSAEDLAKKAGVSSRAVWRFENCAVASPGPAALKIIAALEACGVEFLPGYAVRLKQ